jgi:hypothetical protein
VIYRMRTYTAIPDRLDDFTAFFLEHLLPVQLRHGARLVGRWSTPDHRVVAIWEYDGIDEFHRIQAAVAADPDSVRARAHRATLGPLFTERQETFMTSTLPPA